tara:strand:- start:59 stop:706 length:648 start_codon:yes stop_codon:yes gene_type:complete
MPKEATLTVVSDPICPWCYIGKARLGLALKEIQPKISLRVEWNPFELNPSLPKKGMDRADYLRIKFGSTSSAKRIYDQILINAEADELEINFEAIKKVPNTRDAHKLILSANSPKLQNLIVNKLFEAYFILGVDIGEASNLLNIAVKSGFQRSEAENILVDPELNSRVETLEEHASNLGIMGVPAFLYNGHYLFSGAQSTETIRLSIVKAHKRHL